MKVACLRRVWTNFIYFLFSLSIFKFQVNNFLLKSKKFNASIYFNEKLSKFLRIAITVLIELFSFSWFVTGNQLNGNWFLNVLFIWILNLRKCLGYRFIRWCWVIGLDSVKLLWSCCLYLLLYRYISCNHAVFYLLF